MNDDIHADDNRPLTPKKLQEKKLKGPTHDIMSDEEINTASARILDMIDAADEGTPQAPPSEPKD